MDDYPAADDIPDLDTQHHELIEFLTNNHEMRKAAKHSLQQGLFAGAGAVAGGFLLGPIGGLVEGIAGSIVGFSRAEDYDGAIHQILKLETSRKSQLVSEVHQVLRTAGAQQLNSAEAFKEALVQFASQRAVRDQVWRACLDSIRDE